METKEALAAAVALNLVTRARAGRPLPVRMSLADLNILRRAEERVRARLEGVVR